MPRPNSSRAICLPVPRRSSYMLKIALAAFQRIRAAGYRPYVTENIVPSREIHHFEVVGYIGFFGMPDPQLEGLAVVNVSHGHEPLRYPSVLPDSVLAGRQAAEHLLNRGYTNLIYASRTTVAYSPPRGAGVRLAATRAQARFAEIDGSVTDRVLWEACLPKLRLPAGIVAADDTVAGAVLEAVPALGIRVPEQLAVVGITNEETACATTYVPLSSVDLSPAEIGDQAARLVLRLLAGRAAPEKPILIKPHGVVVRASSDAFATTDPLIAQITAYARDHLGEGLTVHGLARVFGMSRRNLSRVFSERTDTSVVGMLQRLAVEQSKHLLANTDLSIPQVAARCGYNHLTYFTNLFRRHVGTPPAAYRQSVPPLCCSPAAPPAGTLAQARG